MGSLPSARSAPGRPATEGPTTTTSLLRWTGLASPFTHGVDPPGTSSFSAVGRAGRGEAPGRRPEALEVQNTVSATPDASHDRWTSGRGAQACSAFHPTEHPFRWSSGPLDGRRATTRPPIRRFSTPGALRSPQLQHRLATAVRLVDGCGKSPVRSLPAARQGSFRSALPGDRDEAILRPNGRGRIRSTERRRNGLIPNDLRDPRGRGEARRS